jgi:hypothetical protein
LDVCYLLFRIDFNQFAPTFADKLPDVVILDLDVTKLALAHVFLLGVDSRLRIFHDVE